MCVRGGRTGGAGDGLECSGDSGAILGFALLTFSYLLLLNAYPSSFLLIRRAARYQDDESGGKHVDRARVYLEERLDRIERGSLDLARTNTLIT